VSGERKENFLQLGCGIPDLCAQLRERPDTADGRIYFRWQDFMHMSYSVLQVFAE
jgi:hypothetical protein